MADRIRARCGRLLILAVAGAALCALLVPSVAMAADDTTSDDVQTFEQLFLKLQNTPVYKDACTKTCHGNIANTKNYASEIIFSHGYHQLVTCSACHPRFPHRADTTIERPTMQGCFDCHGVRHGSMGVIATDACEDCHVTPKERLRPAFHTYGWAGTDHVKPAEEEFNTKCAMCHKPDSCTTCHDQQGVVWSPESWDYNAGDGCLACHGDTGLTKQTGDGAKSFMVSGLDSSAHSDLSCQDCHSDYRYDDQAPASSLYTINASNSCASCHEKQEDERLSAPVAEYNKSVHAEQIAAGNYDSATCSSCHGGHYIERLDTEFAKQRMHMSSFRTCSRCKQHGDNYDTYDDYYHGKAYKAGATDAPACWDCHEAHDILPSSDKDSSVNEANVAATCGQDGCHAGSNAEFGATSAALIHTKDTEAENNPLRKLISRLTGQ